MRFLPIKRPRVNLKTMFEIGMMMREYTFALVPDVAVLCSNLYIIRYGRRPTESKYLMSRKCSPLDEVTSPSARFEYRRK